MGGKRRVRKTEEQVYDDEFESEDEVEEVVHKHNQVAKTGAWHKFLLVIKDTILKPFFMGAAGAFGISVGYALYDVSAFALRNWAIIKATTATVQAVTGSSSS
eukprot:TRINITY_DN11581_c0_g1_i1.p1 TRINITY_DN11581_c0_g1~~TRINITY_DN11581_c0_g1_i1.p1  ORF type:complete len:103 (+),score=41.49 TRINITY_DN11581_c0_g1_i1:97-405(+)